jgi:lipopolysaccharide export system permease protein
VTLLFRYISKELLLVFLVSAIVLLLIGIGGRLMGYLQEAALGRFSAEAVLMIMAFRLPEFLQLVLPFAFYIALILTLGRLFADQEMTVLLASGTAPVRVLSWLMGTALLLALLVGWLSLVITPRLEVQRAQYMLEQAQNREFEGITGGMFQSFSGGARVTYAESVSDDRRRLQGVFIGDISGSAPVAVWAEAGSQYLDEETGSRFLLLENGVHYEGIPGSGEYRTMSFGTLAQRIARPDPELQRLRRQARPTLDLWREGSPEARAEVHWRLALPIMTLLAALLAFGLSKARPRQGRFARIVPALGVVLAYYLALVLAQNALTSGRIPAVFGLWPAHLAALVAGIWLIRRIDQPARAG